MPTSIVPTIAVAERLSYLLKKHTLELVRLLAKRNIPLFGNITMAISVTVPYYKSLLKCVAIGKYFFDGNSCQSKHCSRTVIAGSLSVFNIFNCGLVAVVPISFSHSHNRAD